MLSVWGCPRHDGMTGWSVLTMKESFLPVEDEKARVLLLGSLPGDASLSLAEYYGHSRNAFWPIMGELLGFSPQLPYEARLNFLKLRGIALWDVVSRAYRRGSLDSDIREAEPNDIPALLRRCPGIVRIGCNGGAAYTLLKKFYPELFRNEVWEIVRLPSTSPAAAMISYSAKRDAYASFLKELIGETE